MERESLSPERLSELEPVSLEVASDVLVTCIQHATEHSVAILPGYAREAKGYLRWLLRAAREREEMRKLMREAYGDGSAMFCACTDRRPNDPPEHQGTTCWNCRAKALFL